MAPRQENMNTGPNLGNKNMGFWVASVLQRDRGDRRTCCQGGDETPQTVRLYGLNGYPIVGSPSCV